MTANRGTGCHFARPDGSARRAVHTAPWNAMMPVWSPDGDRIAVLRWGSELRNWLMILDLDGNASAVVEGAAPLMGGGADWIRSGSR